MLSRSSPIPRAWNGPFSSVLSHRQQNVLSSSLAVCDRSALLFDRNACSTAVLEAAARTGSDYPAKTFYVFCGGECEGPPGADLFTVFGGTNSGVELFF